MTFADYDAIRRDPRRFFVAPFEAHVCVEVEHLVEARGRYFVVEKIGAGAEIAERAASGDRELFSP